MSKKVLILHISKFGGHSQAAANIKEALEYKEPSLKILNINVVGYFYPRTEKVVDFLYTSMIKHIPSLWGKLYDRKEVITLLSPPWQLLNYFNRKRFAHFIERFSPQAIVTTQAFPCGIASYHKSFYNLNIPLVAVVTDYCPHKFWLHPEVDVYSVGCRKAKNILISQGVEKDKIKILGIPISIEFSLNYSREEVAKLFGFDPNLPAVLIMGGGGGIGCLEDIALCVDKLNIKCQIIVICGKNRKLYNWFTRKKGMFTKPLFYFGYVNFVHKIMDFCDIIITKAGGITMAEALSKNLAIIVVNSIPGQEERNVNYLLEQKAILKAKNIAETGKLVETILNDKTKFLQLKEKVKEIAMTDSSLKIAELILKMIK